jgi:hypothetical protein
VTIANYPAFVRSCDANPDLSREEVARKLGLGTLQGVAYAGRLAAERGEPLSTMGKGK